MGFSTIASPHRTAPHRTARQRSRGGQSQQSRMPTIQVHDQELFYTWAPVAGSSGPCLLFTHGLGSSSSFFATVIPALVARGYPCLAFDTPGG